MVSARTAWCVCSAHKRRVRHAREPRSKRCTSQFLDGRNGQILWTRSSAASGRAPRRISFAVHSLSDARVAPDLAGGTRNARLDLVEVIFFFGQNSNRALVDNRSRQQQKMQSKLRKVPITDLEVTVCLDLPFFSAYFYFNKKIP